MNSSIDLPKTPREVSSVLDGAYKEYHGIGGLVLRARPYICPFEEILSRIYPTNTLLDVGCGNGSFSTLLAEAGLAKQIVGIDVSRKAINIARKAKPSRGSKVAFEVMGPGEFPEGLFDTVVVVDVLHHVNVSEQRQFIKSLCEKVKPGGQLVIKDISPLPRWKAAANTAHDIMMANQWVNYISEYVVLKWFEDEGMKIIESCRLDRLWYGHYLISARKT